MQIELTTDQLGLLHYATSDTHMSIWEELEKGINVRDMPDEELRQTFKELGKLAQMFQKLHHQAWVKDMEEADKNKPIKPIQSKIRPLK